MKLSNTHYCKHLLSLIFVCVLTPAFCQDKKEIEDKVTTIFMKIVGKFNYEHENEYGESEKVSGYRWATEIKSDNLIFVSSIEKVVKPLNTSEFSSKQSYDVICTFPLRYYERIIKLENGLRIWSNENSSCKQVKKNLTYTDNGKTFKAEDKVEYYKGFNIANIGGELSDEDISLLDDLLKQLNGSTQKLAPKEKVSSTINQKNADTISNSKETIVKNVYKILPIKFPASFKDVVKYEFGTESIKHSNYDLLTTNTCSNVEHTRASSLRYLSFSNSYKTTDESLIKRNSKTINLLRNYLQTKGLANQIFSGDVTYFFSEGELIKITISIEQEGTHLGKESDFEGLNVFSASVISAFTDGLSAPKFGFATVQNDIYYKIEYSQTKVSDVKYQYFVTFNIGNAVGYNNLCLTSELEY